MDYEVMWNELKGFINNKCNKENDDIPRYIYELVYDKIDDIESQHANPTEHGDYQCIEDCNTTTGSTIVKNTECYVLSET